MKSLCLALVVGIVVGVSSTQAQELLYNPGFEDLSTPGVYGDGWGAYGAASFNAFFGANGHASLFMDNPGNFGGVFQTGIAGAGGMKYQFDLLDVRIESNADANVRFGLEYYLGDDSTAAGPADIVAIPIPPTGDGLSFSMMGIAPLGTQFVRPIIQFDDVQSTADGQENMFVFGASLTKVVPEPAAGLLLAIGLVGLLATRRSMQRDVVS
jgi:PEP-CTERM motif